MKPILTATDFRALKSVMLQLPPNFKTKEVQQLFDELDSVEIVQDSEIASDVIRLNSYFETEDEATKKTFKFTLTLPAHANLNEKKISILSPIGIALIGYKEGMTIDCALPMAIKN